MTENTAGVIYRPVASDPDSATITYAISGGADAARFVLANGELRFTAAPNFDLPVDTDEDNVYTVQISASDGTASTTIDLRVNVVNDKEGIRLRRVATGFDDPMGMVSLPGENRFLVYERGGRILKFDPTSGTTSPFLTIAVSTAGEGGLSAVAPLAEYASNGSFAGAFWVLYTAPDGTFRVQLGSSTIDFGSPGLTFDFVRLTTLPAGSSATGWMQLAPDGKVYVATSDAIGASDPSQGAMSRTSIFGKLFVIERNPDPFAGASPQYFMTRDIASGLRQPKGGVFAGDRLILADRGATVRQEVNRIDVATNGNFGWPYKEGTQTLRDGGPTGLIDPVLEYTVGTGLGMGTGIVGGVAYRGTIASLAGQYIFADRRGEVFTIPLSRLSSAPVATATSIERRRADFVPDVGELNQPVAIVEGASNDVYIIDADGDIFRVDAG